MQSCIFVLNCTLMFLSADDKAVNISGLIEGIYICVQGRLPVGTASDAPYVVGGPSVLYSYCAEEGWGMYG